MAAHTHSAGSETCRGGRCRHDLTLVHAGWFASDAAQPNAEINPFGDKPFSLLDANLLRYDRRLNTVCGTLDHEILWETPAGKRCRAPTFGCEVQAPDFTTAVIGLKARRYRKVDVANTGARVREASGDSVYDGLVDTATKASLPFMSAELTKLAMVKAKAQCLVPPTTVWTMGCTMVFDSS